MTIEEGTKHPMKYGFYLAIEYAKMAVEFNEPVLPYLEEKLAKWEEEL